MKVIGRDVLTDFCARHADVKGWIEGWLAEVEAAAWSTPQSVKDRYASASFLADNHVIFNVRGNRYRLELAIAYRTGIVRIIWAGSHAEYDARRRS